MADALFIFIIAEVTTNLQATLLAEGLLYHVPYAPDAPMTFDPPEPTADAADEPADASQFGVAILVFCRLDVFDTFEQDGDDEEYDEAKKEDPHNAHPQRAAAVTRYAFAVKEEVVVGTNDAQGACMTCV